MLKTLRAQIAHYKSELTDEELDSLLEERRRALGFLDGISSAMNTAHITPPRPQQQRGRAFVTPTLTPSKLLSSPGKTYITPGGSISRSSSSSSLPSSLTQTPFAAHFERGRRLIQPLFPMGMDSQTSSPENSFEDLREVEGKRGTGEFEPPDEISLGRLLNNIIVFEVSPYFRDGVDV